MSLDRLITTLGAVLIQQQATADELLTAARQAASQANYTHTLLTLASAHQTHGTQQTREALRRALEKGGERWAEAARDLT
jgi:hypothetical protein